MNELVGEGSNHEGVSDLAWVVWRLEPDDREGCEVSLNDIGDLLLVGVLLWEGVFELLEWLKGLVVALALSGFLVELGDLGLE